MEINNRDKDDIYNLFIERVCKNDEIFINRQSLLINVNYRITDPKAEMKEKIIPEKEGFYTESPVLEINDVEKFKIALYNYVKAYVQTESRWTRNDISNNWEDIAIYGMSIIWTDATNMDFSNPIGFLNRYTDFLSQDQWEDLKEAKEANTINGVRIWKQIEESDSERETPHNYYLFTKDEEGNKIFLPSICYGIQNDKAYIYALHKIHGKGQKENLEIQNLRTFIKGRGVEPLGIATMLSFIQESKKRGIKKIVMPDNFVMQYTTKNRLKEDFLKWYYYNSQEKIEETRAKNEDILDSNHRGSLNNRLMTMFLVNKYYSTGLKFLEIPGEVSDNLTVDIQNFKLGREEKKKEDGRKKGREEER